MPETAIKKGSLLMQKGALKLDGNYFLQQSFTAQVAALEPFWHCLLQFFAHAFLHVLVLQQQSFEPLQGAAQQHSCDAVQHLLSPFEAAIAASGTLIVPSNITRANTETIFLYI
jgi:hypothetical protein